MILEPWGHTSTHTQDPSSLTQIPGCSCGALIVMFTMREQSYVHVRIKIFSTGFGRFRRDAGLGRTV